MRTTVCIFVLSLLTSYQVQSQELNRIICDERSGTEILYGYCNREGLQGELCGDFFKAGYDAYSPNPEIIKKLRKHKKGLSIIIVLATWCPDSREHVPHFYKILDKTGIPEKSIKVICVDGYKECEGVDLDKYDIQKVPTFIFYRNGEETGRIIESPEISLEEDLLAKTGD